MTQQIETPEFHGARRGNSYHTFVNDKTLSGSQQTLTDATLVINLSEGTQALILEMCYTIESVADDCEFEVVAASLADGAGSITTLHGHDHKWTPAALSGSESGHREFRPPILVKYSTGYRSVTMRVNGNDASIVVSCGFSCMIEKEV